MKKIDPLDPYRKQCRIDAAKQSSAIIAMHQNDSEITELEISAKLGLAEYGVRWLLMDRGFEPRYVRSKESIARKSPVKPPEPRRVERGPEEIERERRRKERQRARKVECRERDRKIVAMYLAGYSLRTIAPAVGIVIESVRKVLIRNGIELRPRGGRQCVADEIAS